jgi:hypothetical protein
MNPIQQPRNHLTALVCATVWWLVIALVVVLPPGTARAQMPGSAFNAGATGAPSSALHGATPITPAPAASGVQTPAWTPRAGVARPDALATAQPGALQQANLPADLAKLNDSAIIIIGGKPTPAGEVKRAVLSLDDKAIIIIGGRSVPAGELKRQLQPTGPRAATAPAAAGANGVVVPPAAAPTSGNRPANAPRAGNGAMPRARMVSLQKLAAVSAHRARLQGEFQALLEDQNRVADALSHERPNVARVSTPSGISVWPTTQGRETVPATPGSKLTYGIHSVNGRTGNVRLVAGGKLVINGIGFGTAPASARLVSPRFNGQSAPLRIDWWSPAQIDAVIPSDTRGVPDDANATLEVHTSDGSTYRFAGISFTAARGETTITDGAKIERFVEWITGNSQWNGRGKVGQMRVLEATSLDCPQVGTDRIHFRKSGGFEVVGASMVYGRTDAGDGDKDGWPGGRVFSGTYAFGDWADQDLPVSWGVWRSHTSPRTYLGNGNDDKSRFVDDPFLISMDAAVFALAPPIGAVNAFVNGIASPIHTSDPWDICESGWALSALTLWGPAGVTP